jgi:hypothetical protein
MNHDVLFIRRRVSWLAEQLLACQEGLNTRGADKSLALERKQQATGLKKCIYSTYSPLSSTHLWLRCSNFFNPSKKNSFGCAANGKSQRLISTPTYFVDVLLMEISLFRWLLRCCHTVIFPFAVSPLIQQVSASCGSVEEHCGSCIRMYDWEWNVKWSVHVPGCLDIRNIVLKKECAQSSSYAGMKGRYRFGESDVSWRIMLWHGDLLSSNSL